MGNECDSVDLNFEDGDGSGMGNECDSVDWKMSRMVMERMGFQVITRLRGKAAWNGHLYVIVARKILLGQEPFQIIGSSTYEKIDMFCPK
ncbi:hypothetical protein HNY73_014098 [Argiope bruennichi]|uniref:Uncharacterized protein n=1 Tax=Argiope bruennichi TaxID=94029 RepID=A0A8T0ES60_ARGBR|nr:hypothetical protein HNY73_014098 [Argiope bruennichi]